MNWSIQPSLPGRATLKDLVGTEEPMNFNKRTDKPMWRDKPDILVGGGKRLADCGKWVLRGSGIFQLQEQSICSWIEWKKNQSCDNCILLPSQYYGDLRGQHQYQYESLSLLFSIETPFLWCSVNWTPGGKWSVLNEHLVFSNSSSRLMGSPFSSQ